MVFVSAKIALENVFLTKGREQELKKIYQKQKKDENFINGKIADLRKQKFENQEYTDCSNFEEFLKKLENKVKVFYKKQIEEIIEKNMNVLNDRKTRFLDKKDDLEGFLMENVKTDLEFYKKKLDELMKKMKINII